MRDKDSAKCSLEPLQSAGCTIVQNSVHKTVSVSNLHDSADECYCGLKLHPIKSGDLYFKHCPVHGSAYVQDAIELARHLPRPA